MNHLAVVAAGFLAGFFAAWWFYRVEPGPRGGRPEGHPGGPGAGP